MKKVLAVAIVAAGLSACAELAVIGGLATTAVGAYCAGTSDAAKEWTRDVFAAGEKVIACEDAE